MKKVFLVLFTSIFFFWSCGDDNEPGTSSDGFDREELLINWADNLIIPAYEGYHSDLTGLKQATETFTATPNQDNLTLLREKWLTAYLSWQSVSMFEIGKAELLTLRDFTNIYPTSAADIETNITLGTYDFQLPSMRNQQGFPVIDYLIYGLGDDATIVSTYQSNNKYSTYLTSVVTRLYDLTTQVVNDWKNGYRDVFVSKSGSDATSSVNKLVNDFLLYYEKSLRAGKVGIPAGVFSTTPLTDRVEGYYKGDISKQLLKASFTSVVNFFNGKNHNGTIDGVGLDDYLTYLNGIRGGDNLSVLINSQFGIAEGAINVLNDNFVTQIETDNTKMLTVFDELQKNVILLKIDMFQDLNIKVDYVDADGD